jgi:uncharacterized protein YecE (DUF72 family)
MRSPVESAIRVGPAGWSYADWEGIVHPRRKPRAFHPLDWIASGFDCVEINASFYRAGQAAHAERWLELLADRPAFRFLAKLHQDLSHGPHDEAAFSRALEQGSVGLEPLARAGRLSALLAQFPVSFARTPEAQRRLEWLAESVQQAPLAVELRHRSWYGSEPDRWLARLPLSRIEIDLPPAREHPPDHPAPVGPIGYLRLHGRNALHWFRREAGRDQRYDYLYSPRELEELAARARRIAGEHDQSFVVTNNHFEGQAVANALELRALLGGEPIPAPAELLDRFPRLRACTRPMGQGSLF